MRFQHLLTPLVWFAALSFCLIVIPPAAAASTGDAARVNQVLITLKTPKPGNGPQTLQLVEEDVNAWVDVVLQARKATGVKAISIDFLGENRVAGKVTVDLDEIDLERFSAGFLKKVLSGEQELQLEGTLTVTDGKGSFVVDKAEMNGWTIPAQLANSIIGFLTSRQPPNVDITEPFDLPFGIIGIRTTESEVVISR